MNRKKLLLSSFFLGAFFILTAQETQTYTYEDKAYLDALDLFHKNQYQAAQTLFKKVKTSTRYPDVEANSAYYAAQAAIRLHQKDAGEMMEDFVERYPTSPKRNTAFLAVGDYYFETAKYGYALQWYEGVEEFTLSRADRERFNFATGYALYVSQMPQEAVRYLSRVTDSPKYGTQAQYYLGYIAYEHDQYEEASARFDQITDPELRRGMFYYETDLSFKQGNFEQAITLGQKYLPQASHNEASELNKIIGESYFNLKQYAKALPYLEKYRGKQGKHNHTDYYRIGYCYYQQQDYQGAIRQFNKIIGGADSIAQNAYYHLAECYLKLNKKPEALNAFRTAAQMDFSTAIQQDALLNYARLSYEIGNPYEPVPHVLATYLEHYPRDKHQLEVQELLVDSYITSRNFKAALQLLEANPGYANKETYQKVAYYRGVEFYRDGNYELALEYFSKSLQNAENKEFEARTLYWKAESAYRLERFAEALAHFVEWQHLPAASSMPEYQWLEYTLGYCYFKQKEYNEAIVHFKNGVHSGSPDEERVNDGYMRLGDSYFATRKYSLARQAYEKAAQSNSPERDYAAFQKALCVGFMEDQNTKMAELRDFLTRYPQSPLRDDVLFELANTYVTAHEEDRGVQTYVQLVTQYPTSIWVPQSLLRQGLVHYNTGRNKQALTPLKNVVQHYPNTQAAQQAVATAKLIYVEEGKVGEYAAWARNLGFVEVTDTEVDHAAFDAAQQKDREGKTIDAIKRYEAYLKEFPNGLHALEAHFYLAQHYFAKGEKEKALVQYQEVTRNSDSEFTEQALTRICEIYVEKQIYPIAISYLERLEYLAEIPQNKTFAQSNLMKGYYEQKAYGKTLTYAEKVIKAPKVDTRIKSDAYLMMGRSARATHNEALAKTAYEEVKKTATGEQAAEAWYYEAYFKHKNQAYEASNVAVQTLVKDYAPYKEWGGKGLVLMAKNFYRLGDAFQATYILESVLSNFTEYEELVAEAQEELSLIKAKEAQRNASLDPNAY